jgi:hypothetical protein
VGSVVNMFPELGNFDKSASMGSYVNNYKDRHFCKYISGPGHF